MFKELISEIENVSHYHATTFGIERTNSWHMLKLQEEMGELTKLFMMLEGNTILKGIGKNSLKDSFGKELADVFCHVLLLAKKNDIDISEVVKNRWLPYSDLKQ